MGLFWRGGRGGKLVEGDQSLKTSLRTRSSANDSFSFMRVK